MGTPALPQDPRFASSPLRRQNVAELDAIINAWAAVRTVTECEQAMIRAGVPCGPIVTLDMLEREANLVHRETVHRMDDPETLTSIRVPASPIRGTPVQGLKPSRIPARDEDRTTVVRILSARTQWP